MTVCVKEAWDIGGCAGGWHRPMLPLLLLELLPLLLPVGLSIFLTGNIGFTEGVGCGMWANCAAGLTRVDLSRTYIVKFERIAPAALPAAAEEKLQNLRKTMALSVTPALGSESGMECPSTPGTRRPPLHHCAAVEVVYEAKS